MIKEELKEMLTRGYLARPTGQGRAFSFMETPEWEGFVNGVSKVQAIELLALFKREVEEIIGEDESQDLSDYDAVSEVISRNTLREQQRARLDKLLK